MGSMVGRIHSLTKKYKSRQVNARRPHQYDKDQEFIHTISKKLDDTQTFSLEKFIFLSEVLNPDKKKNMIYMALYIMTIIVVTFMC